VAGHLLYVGGRLVRRGLAGWMDEAREADYAAVVRAINSVRENDWYDVHFLRLRRIGGRIQVDFHLTVPADWSIERGHVVSERLEQVILDELGMPGSVLVHLDIFDRPEALDDRDRYPYVDRPFTVDGAVRRLQHRPPDQRRRMVARRDPAD